jgi:four helix bundle protein
MKRGSFRDLQIWQKSVILCVDLYKLSHKLPVSEKFGMVGQIQRAALSVSTNIAEGHGRGSDPDFIRFLYMSIGSIRELETLLEIAFRLEYFESIDELTDRLQEIAKMTVSLISVLKTGD